MAREFNFSANREQSKTSLDSAEVQPKIEGRAFKDSGIEWIGQIPKEWEVCRLKNVGYLYGGLTGKAGDDFNVGDEDTSYMLYIPFTNIFNNDTINPDQLFKVKIESGEVQNLVQKGDLLFLMSSEDFDGVGKPAIMEEQVENLGLNSFCKGMRVTNSETNSKYLFYLLSSHLLRELVRQEAKGFIRINLRQDRLSCCPVFLPSLTEQQKIADYLDKVCGEVDEMVTLQETMIEELKAYKQSVITEAVTKGLNPNVSMRDSGIDWIGEIPEHWEVQPFKWILRKPLQYGANESGLLYDESLPRYVRITDIFNNCLREDLQKQSLTEEQADGYILEDNDILFARSGGTVGKAFIYKKGYGRCAFAGYLIRAQIKAHCCPNYVYYYTQSQSYDEWKRQIFIQATIQNIGADRYSLMELPVPPLSEQRTIASYLDTKCSEIDALIALKQAKITELKEYKKSVIYEYVTGKKEVV